MAAVDFFSAFGYSWGQDGSVYNWDESQYKQGWATNGSVPPSVEQFNRVHQLVDQKSNWLYGQLSAAATANGVTLAAGDLTALVQILAAAAPDASTTKKGLIELATNAETQAGTDTVRAVTPAGLKSMVTAAATDTTAGRVLKVGDWGIGGALPVISGADLLADDNFCTFYVTSALNAPGSVTAGYVTKSTRTSAYRTVTFTPFSGRGPYINVCNNGTWNGWVEVLHTGNAARCMTFAQIDALTSDQGPVIVTDMGCMPWVWTNTAYFTGYRNPLCGEIPQHFAQSPRAWEMAVTGGVWSTSDPKQKRLIAWFREQGLVILAANWKKGDGYIADLGSGDWKAPDLRDSFLRMSGTDVDTANPRAPGAYQADALQAINGAANNIYTNVGNAGASGAFRFSQGQAAQPSGTTGAGGVGTFTFNSSLVARTSSETRGPSTGVLFVVLV